jgi:Fe-S cluster assembly protein SufD
MPSSGRGRSVTSANDYSARFTGLELAHKGPSWLAERRCKALASFEAQGLPTKRHEDWKYTDIKPIAEGSFSHELGEPAYALTLPEGAAGIDKAGERLGTVASLDGRPFAALNAALFQRGFSIRVPAGEERSVRLVHDVCGRAEVHPRGLVVVEAGARLVLVEEWRGEGEAFVNALTEVVLDEGASMEHHLWQRHGAGVSHVHGMAVEAGAKSRYEGFGLWLGGRLSRMDWDVRLVGEEASCRLDGLYAAVGGQHMDVHSFIDHAVPRCTSTQLYKGMMGARGRGVFNGKVVMRPGAYKSDASQANHNLLLHETSEVDTKPQLEIFADDVKASHGATVGQLDDEQLFYLQSRGIPAEVAAHILLGAFALDVLDRMPDASLRDEAAAHVKEKLAALEEAPS